MHHNPGRVEALKSTLQRVSQVATVLEPSGISIRFLNHQHDENGDFDNLDDVNLIMTKVNIVYRSEGGATRLGTVLNRKIVLPMIINKLQQRSLEKPLIVLIITDGEVCHVTPISTNPFINTYPNQPTKEPKSELASTISKCKRVMEKQNIGDASAVFIISQVGNAPDATDFLRSIQDDKETGSMVHCSMDKLDQIMAQFQRANSNSGYSDSGYTAWVSQFQNQRTTNIYRGLR